LGRKSCFVPAAAFVLQRLQDQLGLGDQLADELLDLLEE